MGGTVGGFRNISVLTSAYGNANTKSIERICHLLIIAIVKINRTVCHDTTGETFAVDVLRMRGTLDACEGDWQR